LLLPPLLRLGLELGDDTLLREGEELLDELLLLKILRKLLPELSRELL
jgi:hypothetical protein